MTIAASLTVRREGLNCPLRKWDGVDRKEREAHNQRRGILQKRPPLLVLQHQPGGPSTWLPLLVDEERNWVSYLFLAVSGLSCDVRAPECMGSVVAAHRLSCPTARGILVPCCCCCSVVMSDSLQPHGLQHPSLPCPLVSPRVCSNSCPLSQWCHLTISSSVAPFSSCPQSFPASGSFPMRWPKYWSFSNSPSNEYSGLMSFRMDWLYFLAVYRTLKSFLHHHNTKASTQPSLWSSSHTPTWLLENP